MDCHSIGGGGGAGRMGVRESWQKERGGRDERRLSYRRRDDVRYAAY